MHRLSAGRGTLKTKARTAVRYLSDDRSRDRLQSEEGPFRLDAADVLAD